MPLTPVLSGPPPTAILLAVGALRFAEDAGLSEGEDCLPPGRTQWHYFVRDARRLMRDSARAIRLPLMTSLAMQLTQPLRLAQKSEKEAAAARLVGCSTR